ncbi:E2 protein [Vulpes vulpes papillomavirus 1]|uniref:Regulatory protein E2 n=1 Tax=Vulpes vulpes papillomavirus 1 TaxID=1163709 RepID=A0A0A7BWG9_9PAPI|nr:E2 protein [Vulpes vulpes papillomavirus 1]AHM27269.1 E2 protein [Vulpes vulpes papillomavirus 1]
METLRERFDALQEQLLTLYEQENNDLESQLLHWKLQRKESALMYYARKNGLASLGMQRLPSLQVSEQQAKQAILMTLYLESLSKTPYAKEHWTLQDTSYERFMGQPPYCFKKGPFTVDVVYDKDSNNMFSYTNYNFIYYQDEDENWHKTSGEVSYEGLYYTDYKGRSVYFVYFEKDAQLYSQYGTWEVHFKNQTISASVVSTSTGTGSGAYDSPDSSPPGRRSTGRPRVSEARQPANTSPTAYPEASEKTALRKRPGPGPGQTSPSPSAGAPKRRRRGEREQVPRQLRSTPSVSSGTPWPSPGQVGRRSRLPPRHNSSRLRRLQAEAWDPPVILLKGKANNLKCWRNRVKQRNLDFKIVFSSLFNWIGLSHTEHGKHRMLLAFDGEKERRLFLDTVKLPKGVTYSLGNLDSL